MRLNLPKQRIIQVEAVWWKRLLSFMIDFFIIQVIVFGPFSPAIANSLPLSEDFMENYAYFQNNPGIIEGLMSIFLVAFFLVGVYFVIFEFKMKQTPGKMLFKLKVVPLEKEELTFWKVLARNIAVVPIFPFSALWIVDPLYMIFTGSRLSDKFSRTKVVEEVTA